MAIKDSRGNLCVSRLMIFFCVLLMLAVSLSIFASADNKTSISIADTMSWEFPDAPVIVNDSTLDSALKHYSPFILDCWEEGCMPCQLIAPTIDEMAQDFRGKVVFGKLRTDQNHNTRVKYHIYHYPMLLVFKNGSLVYKHLGNYPKATLEKMILEKLGIN